MAKFSGDKQPKPKKPRRTKSRGGSFDNVDGYTPKVAKRVAENFDAHVEEYVSLFLKAVKKHKGRTLLAFLAIGFAALAFGDYAQGLFDQNA